MFPTNSAVSRAVAADRSRTRYWILAMLFIVTTVNYADRATLSITGPAIKQEFGFSDLQMGYIFSAFSWAYVMAQIPGGWLLDRFGARRVYAASIFAWSLFTVLQSTLGAFATVGATASVLFLMRFTVGLAESPAFPANAKVVASWFPKTERGTASAVFNSAQYFATVLFTPLMAWMTHAIGWHHVYIWLGVFGMALALIWMMFVKSPARHPLVNTQELQYIRDGGGLVDMDEGPRLDQAPLTRAQRWGQAKQLLTNRMLLGVYLGQYCINVLTYFFLTWFPVYLVQQRGMTILKAGFVASLPAVCGFVGGVLGGILSDALVRRGYSLTAARKIPIVGGLLLSTCMVACNYVELEWMVVGFMALAFFGKGIGALGWAVVSDTAPREVIGLAGSIFNMFGNIAGIVTPIVIGYIVYETHSFNGALVFVGANALLAVFSYLVIVGKIERLKLKPV
ncbi:ACS family glucarate transporter-like MFS transporter/ACS family D-galactonate transporter-like MFS transporter [Comamonas sp. BIGb0124]|uniref:MFS transporter n=1 Tax=Comamonas sp. BIGb0124 TaxID=2485130 RepID=UPI000F4A12A6|nr:MFS transporter [Comamonas sp. BIGb0124]ROR20313.1 ACS family glucarate transporter-like MFS transporter/ACS family D-galactonate transporter-like MFS transporter [Comamonas sp. BIGb0124]